MNQTGFTTNYRYDAIGRLAELTDASGAAIVTYTYDAAGRLSSEEKGNGTWNKTYAYDKDGNLVQQVDDAPDGSVNSRFDNTYDADGRMISQSTLDGTTTYSYDADGQLTAVTLPGERAHNHPRLRRLGQPRVSHRQRCDDRVHGQQPERVHGGRRDHVHLRRRWQSRLRDIQTA